MPHVSEMTVRIDLIYSGSFIRHFPIYDFVYTWGHGPQEEHLDASFSCKLVLIQDFTEEYSQIHEKFVFTLQPSIMALYMASDDEY